MFRNILIALTLALIASIASGVEYDLELVDFSISSSNGTTSASGLEGVDFVYDDVAGTVTQISPSTTAVFTLSPVSTLFSQRFSGAVFEIDAAGPALFASSYECIEGNFGNQVGAFLCANTTFGPNFTNETTVDYSTIPGTRSVGGDDAPVGPQQQLDDFTSTLRSFDGIELVISTVALGTAGGNSLVFNVTEFIPPVDVPDVTGLDQSAAEADILAADLATGTVSTANHPSVPTGLVISQNPSGCSACIQAGQPVNFVISLGPIADRSVTGQIAGLRDDVESLELRRRLENSLTRKLDRALARIEQGYLFLAKFNLWFFSRQIEWQAGRKIAAEDALLLSGKADALIERIQQGYAEVPQDGLKKFISQGEERTYYLEVPDDYSALSQPKPLLFMLHGTNGTYERFMPGGLYAVEGEDLREKVGDDAIMVFPNALPDANGTFQWNRTKDFRFFADLIEEIRSQLSFDERQIFATGHSSGGGFSYELGCEMGDVFRAIAPSAGALTSSECIGSVAVMHVQSMNDTVVDPGIAEPTENFWVLYNGFNFGDFTPGVTDPCIDYGKGESPYSLQWCMHNDRGRAGHQWWTKAGAIWDFFATLPVVEPTTEPPPGGGNDRVMEEGGTTLSFTVEFPADIGPVYQVAATLYPAGTQQPVFVAPFWFLNTSIDAGPAIPGTRQDFVDIPVQIFTPSPQAPLPGTYTLSLAFYVEGGGFPTPISGIDYILFQDIEIVDRTTPILVEAVLVPEPVL